MPQKPSHRLLSIDAMRGFVIILMLLDHVRETFFLHQQVSDPIDIHHTDFALFFSRSLAHICTPVFVFLTGVSAALYGQKIQSRRDVSSYLFKRGLLLVLFEITIINFAWTFQFPPSIIYLQVIWAIGLSMVVLSSVVWLDRKWIFLLGLLIIFGHNLLDGIHAAKDSLFYIPWAILHDRGWIEFGTGFKMRTSYPILPWIGVICVGYAFGPLFTKVVSETKRRTILVCTGMSCIIAFFLLRLMNGYGEKHWEKGDNLVQTAMSFFNITKYPPSLCFLLITLGLGFLILSFFERHQQSKPIFWLSVFGSVPMFFYILHLYVLKFLYIIASNIWGLNQGQYYGFNSIVSVWVCTIILVIALYFPVRAFSHFKSRRRDIKWLKYF